MISIQSETHFDEILASNQLVLVDFYADWCEPCKYLDGVLERLEKSLSQGVEIAKVDADRFPELSLRHHVLSVPVLMVFAKGALTWRMNGFKLEDELLEIINRISREMKQNLD